MLGQGNHAIVDFNYINNYMDGLTTPIKRQGLET